jgi:ankyrin repeat protein
MVWDKMPEADRTGALGAKALASASASGHTALAAELIRRGVHGTGVSTDAVSITAAIDSVDPDLLKLLFDRGGKLPPPQPSEPPIFIRAVRKCTTGTLDPAGPKVTELLTLLTKHGADANSVDPDGKNALFFSLASPGLTKTLIELGVNVNAKDRAGLTPVLAPTSSSNAQSLELLLSHGASAETKDPSGNTPLMLPGWIQNPDAVKVLLDHKADVNATNAEGFTPLAAAHRYCWGIKETEEMLTKAGAKETPASQQVADQMKARDLARRPAAPLPQTRTSKEDAKKVMPGAGGGGPPRGR